MNNPRLLRAATHHYRAPHTICAASQVRTCAAGGDTDGRKMKLYNEFNWIGYCRSISHGGSPLAHAARVCLALPNNLSTPSRMRGHCERRLTDGTMLEESYRTCMDAIDRVEDGFARGEQTHIIDTSKGGDWDTLPGGGHVRKTHIHSHR